MKISIKYYIYKKLLPAFIFALIFTGNTYSQQDQTIHLMQIIPQSSYTNPAFKPVANWYFGFPALSSLYVGVGHSGFAYRDLIHRLSNGSLGIMMDNSVIDKLGKINYISANVMEELVAFGFKQKKNYFNFSITEKASLRFSYPREIASLVLIGNGQYIGKTADLSGLGVNAAYYREYAIGFARDVKIMNQDFVFGGRVKYLKGLMNIYTKRNNLSWKINEEDFTYTAQTDFLVNVTLPENVFDTTNNDSTNNNNNDFSAGDYLFNKSNTGYGLDLGAYYKYNDRFSFGASLLDFGYIKWKSGGGSEVRNYSSSVESFKFDGVDINQFFNQSDSVVSEKMNKVMDSIADIFKIQETQNSYTAPLPAKMYISGIYTLTPHDRVGLLIRNEFFNKRPHPSFTVSYNKQFFNMLSATASYSIMNRGYMNIGFGLALNLGPWQTYVTTDNLYCLFDPEGTRNVNMHFGFNFIFGYKEKKITESLYQDSDQNKRKDIKQKRKERKQKKKQLPIPQTTPDTQTTPK